MRNKQAIGHSAALFTILIWGTTFISTKLLLVDFAPLDILLIRFLLGYIALWLLYPHKLKLYDIKQEGVFALAGLCGICLYYLLENIALTYTSAANVGVIISIAPFFTAILTKVIGKQTKLHRAFYLGFVISMFGICLISFQERAIELNPFGDFLACVAAFVWACYAILSKKIGDYGYAIIPTTRRMFLYGILFMMPMCFTMNLSFDLTSCITPTALGNLLFLGLGASALCFVTWNFAVKTLGSIRTSVYIYIVPVITVITSMLVLQETITVQSVIGIVLTLIGLFLSEYKGKGEHTHDGTK